ncbi:hypothetical protein ACFWF3_12300, partial [Nocardia sp. NPDC060220]|uniref:hypothetical protein n=1 Tax=Nocardia sp. NPDC060220 TaxID=3347076 RepID=UPI00365C24C1
MPERSQQVYRGQRVGDVPGELQLLGPGRQRPALVDGRRLGEIRYGTGVLAPGGPAAAICGPVG